MQQPAPVERLCISPARDFSKPTRLRLNETTLSSKVLRGDDRRLSWRELALLSMGGDAAMFDGFVAGINAGFTYNTFPLMDGDLVPAGYGALQPWPLNLFENVAAVQFNHRLLGVATLALAAGLWLWSRRWSGPITQASIFPH